MKNKQWALLMAFFAVVFLMGSFIPATYATTYYVARDGSGNYNCDGSADQVEINQALAAAAKSPGSVVHLKAGKYVISDTIQIGSNTTLEGEPGAVLTFAESFWPAGSNNDALIENNGSKSSVGKDAIVLRGFEIDGDYNNNNRGDSNKDIGDGRRNFINIIYNNLEVYDMYWHNSPGDGIKVRYSTNVKIHDIKADTLGHDAIVLQSCQNGEVYNNNIRTRGNAGVRLFGSSYVKIHDNFIYAKEGEYFSPGGPGLELQRGDKGDDLHDIEVYNNLLYHTWQAGIQLVAFDNPAYTKDQVKNVYIHHNIIANCGWHASYDWMAGIVTSGVYNVVIENNTLDGNYGGGIVYLESLGLQSNGTSGKYDVHIRNNIVTNSVKRGGNKGGSPGAGDASQSGQGIINYNTAEGELILENNLVYGNAGGNYKNVSSSSDINADPLYADRGNGDYHLKSIAGRWSPSSNAWVSDTVNSPGIDAGSPLSDYSNEPQYNGGRINVGVYGNTSQASLTGKTKQETMPAAPREDSFGSGSGSSGSGSGSGSSGSGSSGSGSDPNCPDDSISGSGSGSGSSGSGSGSGSSGVSKDIKDNIPELYDPGKAVLPAFSYSYIYGDMAKLLKSVDLEPLYPELGEAAETATATCTVMEGSAGLIPCGKKMDDPSTEWNECDKCDFCSIPLSLQLITEFLVKIAGIVALLAIVLGQLIAMTSAGAADMMVKIKSVLWSAVLGFVYTLAAWVVVNAILAAIGYTDPMGGEWYTMC
jgi:hypothetical protein